MRKSFQAKEKDIKRKWYLIDVQDMILGRAASKIAVILMGKNKPIYTPNIDTGDFVVAVNAEKIKLTGKKLVQKTDYAHSGYPNGHRFTPYSVMMEKHPERVLSIAVKGMLPKSTLGKKMLTKLKVYRADKHPHSAQSPEILKVN